MKLRMLLGACCAIVCAGAGASGGGGPYDRFVNRGGPDIDATRFQTGELGVLLPGYQRIYLYAAWRAITLGADGLKGVPNPAGALDRAGGNPAGGWTDTRDAAAVYASWQSAIGAALRRNVPKPADDDALARGQFQCPDTSYVFATATLNSLAARPDATPARLQAWIAAQKQVFKACDDDPTAKPRSYGTPKPEVAPPADLPAAEAIWWRQMRDYQVASAHFYSDNFTESARRFALIGATDKHPLRLWGDYLSLRSRIRAVSAASAERDAQLWKQPEPQRAAFGAGIAVWRQQQFTLLNAAAQKILADPTQAPLHEATRASMRAQRARLTPAARFDELSRMLDDLRANPYLDDHLGDWRTLADSQLSYGEAADKAETAMRAAHPFMDWTATLQHCADASDKRCAGEAAHATAQWTGATGGAQRAWLVAAVALSPVLPPALEKAAAQVAPGAPEYLTMRYALARHYRLAGQADKARAVSDAVLGGARLKTLASQSARNLFTQERFAVARSIDDAAAFLMRKSAGQSDADTGEHAKTDSPAEPASDGLRWMNSGLATTDLIALAANARIKEPLRSAILVAAWMRADLLDQQDTALQAARLVEHAAPALADAARQYQALKTPAQRRHQLILSALKFSLSPVITGGQRFADPGAPVTSQTDALADMWCDIPSGASSAYMGLETDAEHAPPAPQTAAPARDAEIARLHALKTSTGFVGAHVLERARSTPADPDLPWLLYVVVQSTRGGCLDADAKTLSKAAFSLLHKRYPGDEWTAKTPYFY